MAPKLEERQVETGDGVAIAARFVTPANPTAAVLIAPAMGVPQRFYAPLAQWLARQGMAVATFDYRGMGASRPSHLRGFEATILDWARFDAAAMLEALERQAPGLPRYWIGHSLGGQIPPLVPGHERLERIVTVACGSGYWRENAPALKRRVWLFWFGAVPLLTPLLGYFPGQRLNMVGDLPRGVVEQWRRWCLDPEYAVGAESGVRERFAAVRTPVVSLSFSDDDFMSARNTESLHGFYANAPRILLRIRPREAGLARIGHFGFFRAEHEQALWQRYLLPALQGRLAQTAATDTFVRP
ncbi:alpha/beta fold hydrolase [Billgrantia sulfidoxydans]|uniref:Alpha/beta fold hydrolase n=1 Tax=Billgrantia sulfidoxydans TaxID=2733484 RepID=A0ABX7W2I0_9GAMM|nr:alpha/beta fold hydrolase [Halomonas sulfidoxydans]QTP53248.1 alpha/beta fold hydrolase [Halomonas sulfidoxydans]